MTDEELRAYLQSPEGSARFRSLPETTQREIQEKLRRYLTDYDRDPVGYARDVLCVTLTPDQEAILRSLLQPPYRTLVKSGHSLGKSFVAAVACSWWYQTRPVSVVVTTAPSERDVIDVLWTEIRQLQAKAGLKDTFIGPRAPEMRTGDDHYAKGFTARRGESFQGRHPQNMLFVFDEAEGIDSIYFTTTKTMHRPDGSDAWLCIYNPTTTTSQVYLEENLVDSIGAPLWNVFSMSALNHPNILAQLQGEPPTISTAVTLSQVDDWVREWCDVTEEPCATDFEWRPGSGLYVRPGPIAEARILGRRPSAGTFGVWSDALWVAVEKKVGEPWVGHLPELGVDGARQGDDYTEIHVRWGDYSVWHEAHNGWTSLQVAERIKALCREWAAKATAYREKALAPVEPWDIKVKIDDDGSGWAIYNLLNSWDLQSVPIGAATSAEAPDLYPNKRSELWFVTANRARAGGVSVARLPREVRERLKMQLMAPVWSPDAKGRRVVEPKLKTKEKIRRSPDSADAMNLAFYSGVVFDIPPTVEARPGQKTASQEDGESPRAEPRAAEAVGLFGLGDEPQSARSAFGRGRRRGFMGR